MTEIVTESFCERCGTRYTFESERPRVRLKGVKVLSRGLKNFVLSDGTTMDEAMASARNETDRELTAHQLDAFHKTFNFCMSCRQYTCPNCWNEVEARCLSCAPHLGHEVLPAPFPDLAPIGANGSNGHHVPEMGAPGAWPVDIAATPVEIAADHVAFDPSETDFDAAARLEMLTAVPALAEPVTTVVAPPLHAVSEHVEAEQVRAEIAAEKAFEPTAGQVEIVDDEIADAETVARLAAFASPTAEADRATPGDTDLRATIGDKATAQTGGLLRRFRPGQNLDDELAAYERDRTSSAAPGETSAAVEAPAVDDGAASISAISAEIPQEIAVEPADVVLSEPELEMAGQPTGATAPEVDAVVAAGPGTVAAAESETVIAAGPETGAAAEPETGAAAEPQVAAERTLVAKAEVVMVTEPFAAEPEPVADEPQTVAARDEVAQPTWRRVAPDTSPTSPTSPAPPAPSIPAAATSPFPVGEPQWPTRPEWLGSVPAAGLPFLNRPVAAQGGIDALWAESNREVVTAPVVPGKPTTGGIQPCVSCGLSLSANARFCRRCGTPQAS